MSAGLISGRRFPHGRGVALFAGSRVVVADSFNRADSALSLGTADMGQVWSALVGTWGISGNAAYNPSATTGAIALVEAGVSNCTVRLKMATRATQSGALLRVVDANNWLAFVNGSSGAMLFQKCVAGTITTVATILATVSLNNDVYEATLSGPTITLRLNGAQIGDPLTVTDHLTATKFGIGFTGAGNAAARWDDFRVTA